MEERLRHPLSEPNERYDEPLDNAVPGMRTVGPGAVGNPVGWGSCITFRCGNYKPQIVMSGSKEISEIFIRTDNKPEYPWYKVAVQLK